MNAPRLTLIPALAALLALPACDTVAPCEADAPALAVAALTAPPPEPIGAQGKTDAAVFNADGTLVNPTADSDRDGISDGDEVAGWLLTLDPDGWAAFLADGGAIPVGGTAAPKATVQVYVTSDPRFADTDGDGLDDGHERAAQADPRKWDTDGDGLTDLEEVTRFGTNPSRVDSDGDATGGDPQHPLPPLAALFDGAELKLVTGADGVRRPGPGATNPNVADTDGDGVNDYDELLSGTRRPAVAEIPEIAIGPTPGSQIDMYINTVTTAGQTDTRTEGTSITFEESANASLSGTLTFAAAHEEYAEAYAKTKDKGGCCLNFADSENEIGVKWDTKTTLKNSATLTFDSSITIGGSYATSSARAREARGEITMTGGTVRLSVDVANTGPVPVRVSDLAIGLSRWDGYTRLYVPVTELLPAQDELGVLAPGTTRTFLVEDTDVPLQAILALLDDPRQLNLTAARLSLEDAGGQDFDFQLDDVLGSTVSLYVASDTGLRRVLVAPANPSGGLTMREALAAAGLDDVTVTEVAPPDGVGDTIFAVQVGDLRTELYSGAAPDLGDTRPYVATDGPGPRWVKRGWFAQVRRKDASRDQTYYPNMLDALLYVGDEVRLVYDEDLDRDGVPAKLEALLGSSDLAIQSDVSPAFPDGDGLSDFWEAYEPWEVRWDGHTPYQVYGSPGLVDADGDGLSDAQEAEAGTDPRLADTDFDSLSDGVEVAAGGDPGATLGADAQRPTVSCLIDRILLPPDYQHVATEITVSATDPQADLTTVLLEALLPAGDYQTDERSWARGRPTPEYYAYTDRILTDVAAIAVGQDVEVTPSADGGEVWTTRPTGAVTFKASANLPTQCYPEYGALAWQLTVTAVDAGGHAATTTCVPTGNLADLGCL